MEQFGKISKLGFGMMRLPKNGEEIDIEQVKTMVDTYLNAGFNYFDTALLYPGSEDAMKKALIERHNRESFKIATKICPTFASLKSKEECIKAFDEQLQRIGVDYIDMYLMHAIRSHEGYEAILNTGFLDLLRQKKQDGIIRHLGFSFHGDIDLFKRVLEEQKDIEFVQIQLNYLDWDNHAIHSGELYRILREKNIPIVVMEPVKGGILANPPAEIVEVLKKVNGDKSFASLALRFVASLDGILTVLSGMSDMEQMEDNLKTFTNFVPLSEEEKEAIAEANRILYNINQIGCTRCGYCMKDCPKQINIPRIFSFANSLRRTPSENVPKFMYKHTPEGQMASDCIKCKKCEKACPQHLAITELLEVAHKELAPA